MPNPAKILERIRAHGANIIIDGGKLQIVNGSKLPDGARDFIKANAAAIADYLEREHEVEERAAIVEFDGHSPREWAEQFAKFCIQHRPPGIDELDWSWFITRCGKIIDEEPDLARAA